MALSDAGLTGALGAGPTRRQFLRTAAIGTAALSLPGLLSGCHVVGALGRQKLDFGDDFGVLNYAYTLEALEAGFYQKVVSSPPRDFKPGEFDIFRDIGAHEVQHRRFFKRALGVLRVKLPEFNWSSIDFTSRDAVLAAARTFEDTGVAAYNGAGKRLRLAEFLTIAGEIVSVEARHAATIRELIDPNSRAFAGDDVVDANGLDRALPPDQVLAAVQPFFKTPVRVAGL
ncbi:MAG: ferritin-like domain-containing protein [Gemmatimonadota bacterium]|nr:ferritin-like domain-containing protein [Gemmatimonadota bacterium]